VRRKSQARTAINIVLSHPNEYEVMELRLRLEWEEQVDRLIEGIIRRAKRLELWKSTVKWRRQSPRFS
jgi:hypothetical protein